MKPKSLRTILSRLHELEKRLDHIHHVAFVSLAMAAASLFINLIVIYRIVVE